MCPKNVNASIKSEEIIELSNQERVKKDLKPIRANQFLTKAAKNKGDFLKQRQIFSHNTEEKKFSDWVSKVGYDYLYVGENLALDFSDSEDVVQAWMNSPLHKKNLLYPEYKEVGVAVIEGYNKDSSSILVVQIFATPSNEKFSKQTENDKKKTDQEKELDQNNNEEIFGGGFLKNITPPKQAGSLSIALVLSAFLSYLYVISLIQITQKN